MEIVRVLSPKHFNKNLSRFSSLDLRNSSGPRGEISVFDRDCAKQNTGSPCSHIDSHYQKISYQPPIFWKISSDQLPNHPKLELDDSKGNPSHYNIFGLIDKEAKRFFQGEGNGEYFICRGVSEEMSSREHLVELLLNGFFD
jgi:hypothetical protein